MTATRTPGSLFLVRQAFPSLEWRVVTLPADQGRAMRDRGEGHVYDTSAQAHAVAKRLEAQRLLRAAADRYEFTDEELGKKALKILGTKESGEES